MKRTRSALAALGVWAAAGAACTMVGGGLTLTDAQQVVADMQTAPSELKIVGAVDRADRRYRTGEPIVLSVELSKEAYAAVLRVMPNGATTLLFPSAKRPSGRLAANAPLRLDGIAADQPGTVMFEITGVDEPTAKRALARVAHKMPVQTRFLTRRHAVA